MNKPAYSLPSGCINLPVDPTLYNTTKIADMIDDLLVNSTLKVLFIFVNKELKMAMKDYRKRNR